MPSYLVSGVKDGRPEDLCTCDTASSALGKFRAALLDHKRAWVTDETGSDVSEAELARRASEEAGRVLTPNWTRKR